MRKRCELCGGEARVHCESDQAGLCWDCDGKVHGANFLVEKHVRVLLCGSCSAPTPWKASGARLGSSVSVCEGCFGDREGGVEVLCGEERQGGVDHDERDEDEDDEDEEGEDAEALEEEDDGENQVVPWAFNSPPPVDSSSTSGEIGDDFDDFCEASTNQTHQITHSDSQGPECCGSCAISSRTGWATVSSNPSSRPAKRQKRVEETEEGRWITAGHEGSRMASKMINLMKTLHDDAISREAAAAAAAT